MNAHLRTVAVVFLFLTSHSVPALWADNVDDVIKAEMKKRQIPGLSLAIIQDGKIAKATGYGTTEAGGKTPVTPSTLFQAGSISKSVAALGALYLVEKGKLSLDEDVNTRLTSWKVPENDFTRQRKVTLRLLLSHTAGLTVHGFPGYAIGEQIPSVVQVLNGEKPANTAPVRVDLLPGSRWRYSGGGFTVMQQLVVDVTRKPYPEFMKEVVLAPLGMESSSFEQPLSKNLARLTATGHDPDRTQVKGRWHVYPEMAAAGLWTTASDLARFAIGIQQSRAGKANPVISVSMTAQMLTNVNSNYGLGVGVESSGDKLRFSHGGRDAGFDAMYIAYAATGQGAAIMLNVNDNSRSVSRILQAIAREYHWPDYPLPTVATRPAAKVSASVLEAVTGRYELSNNNMTTLVLEKGRLFTSVDGLTDEELLPETDSRFFTAGDRQINFLKDTAGRITGFEWQERGRKGKAPRIGPLVHSLKRTPDTYPVRAERVEVVLKALGQPGQAVQTAPGLSPGARRDFAGGVPPLAGLRSLEFVGIEDTADRQIERHDSKVSRVFYGKLAFPKASSYILVYLTADDLVTDFDLVKD